MPASRLARAVAWLVWSGAAVATMSESTSGDTGAQSMTTSVGVTFVGPMDGQRKRQAVASPTSSGKGHGASGQLKGAFHDELALAKGVRTSSSCVFPCFVCPRQGTSQTCEPPCA